MLNLPILSFENDILFKDNFLLEHMTRQSTRRRFLASGATIAGIALAGCTGGSEEESADDGESTDDGSMENESMGNESMDDGSMENETMTNESSS